MHEPKIPSLSHVSVTHWNGPGDESQDVNSSKRTLAKEKKMKTSLPCLLLTARESWVWRSCRERRLSLGARHGRLSLISLFFEKKRDGDGLPRGGR